MSKALRKKNKAGTVGQDVSEGWFERGIESKQKTLSGEKGRGKAKKKKSAIIDVEEELKEEPEEDNSQSCAW